MSPRETRFRRLLALYPGDFRREYADEMLGVLMADPGPVRKHAPSLVAGAVAARLRQTFDGPEWRRAAFAVQWFGAILLCAVAVRRLVMDGAVPIFRAPSGRPPLDVFDVTGVVAWAVFLLATLTGVRVLSVAAALAGLTVQVAAASRGYSEAPVAFLNAYWIVMSAAVVLTASAVSVRGPRPRGLLFVLAGGVVLAANGFILDVSPFSYDYVGALSLVERSGPRLGVTLVVVLVAGALAVTGVVRLEPAVRRRVVAAMVPVAAVFPLVGYGFGGLLEFNQLHPDEIRLLGPVQWAALVVVPVLAFAVAAALNGRLERSRAEGRAGSAPET